MCMMVFLLGIFFVVFLVVVVATAVVAGVFVETIKGKKYMFTPV